MSSELSTLFQGLRALFKLYEPRCVVVHDEPGRYYLGSREVRPTDGQRTLFGGVEIRKSHVAVELVPIDVHPEMAEDVSPELKRRMQGRSRFNLTALDDVLIEDLSALLGRGALLFEADGRL